MYARDFIYGGFFLSDFGFMIGNIGGSNGTEVVTAGTQITFNTLSFLNGQKRSIISTKYDDCITATFQIFKNTDICGISKCPQITDEEYRNLTRWLNRKEFKKFQIIDYDNNYCDYYYEATFNLNRIKINGITYGIELNMITNRPFALHEAVKYSWQNLTIGNTKTIIPLSDEEGYLYPKVILSVKDISNDGLIQFRLYNPISVDSYDTVTEINNCKVGEIITVEHPIITSSLFTHDLFNDFNYTFPRIRNIGSVTYRNRQQDYNYFNILSDCLVDVTLIYNPIVKVGI